MDFLRWEADGNAVTTRPMPANLTVHHRRTHEPLFEAGLYIRLPRVARTSPARLYPLIYVLRTCSRSLHSFFRNVFQEPRWALFRARRNLRRVRQSRRFSTARGHDSFLWDTHTD